MNEKIIIKQEIFFEISNRKYILILERINNKFYEINFYEINNIKLK